MEKPDVFLVLTMLSTVLVGVYSDCHNSRSSIVLEGFTTRSFVSDFINDCFQICKTEPWCQSLNYYTIGSLCELNNRTISQKPLHSKIKKGATYFENPHKAPLGSSASIPAISCDEIKNTSTNTVKAGNYWILDQKTLKPFKEYCLMGEKDVSCSTLPNGNSTGINTLRDTDKVYCDSGWTLIARFSNSDTKNWMRDDGYWWYDVMSAQGSTTSTSVNQDMISPAFWSVTGSEIKITRSDDSSHTALLQTTSNCLGSRTFRSKLSSYGTFKNRSVWSSDRCLGSCSVSYGGQYTSTIGFAQAHCNGNIQSSHKIGFWCNWSTGDGAVMMIGGGGKDCERSDHGIGITENNYGAFEEWEDSGEFDFGNDAKNSSITRLYSLNLWIR